MRISASQRSGVERCPLCFTELEDDDRPWRCDGCQVLYHPDCADELGGCGTLGCAKNGIGPSGPASLEAIRRHVEGVQAGNVRRGGGGGYPGRSLESERAAAIREALLEQRARLLAQEKARRDFERGKLRKARLEFVVAALLLIATLYIMLREFI